jgi:hypothetical protein
VLEFGFSSRAGVAQLVEHFIRNEGVRGSNPRVGSLIRTGLADDVAAVLDLWRRAEASASSTESATDVRRLLERGPEALSATSATRMIGKADIGRVRQWMEHADIQTTVKYLHYAPREGGVALVAEAFRVEETQPRTHG